MSEHRADEDLNVPSFLQEGADGSRSDTADPRGADPGQDPRAGRTGAQIIGGCLAGAREEKGISVDAVYAATRIRPALVRSIEAGDLEKCGGGIYARGHIRAIAQVVGLDADALLQEYLPASPVDVSGNKALTVPVRGKAQARIVRPGTPKQRAEQRKDGAAGAGAADGSATKATSKGKAAGFSTGAGVPVKGKAAAGIVGAAYVVPPSQSTLAPATRPTSARGLKKVSAGLGSQKGANWTAAMAAVLVGLVIVGGAQMIGGHDKSSDAKAAAAKAPAPAVAPPPAPKPAPPVVPAGVAFKVAAVDAPSWLAVYSSDGKKLYDALLDAGAVQTFSDGQELLVTLGNASAVHMALNGKDLGSAGGDGQVVTFMVKPAGVVTS